MCPSLYLDLLYLSQESFGNILSIFSRVVVSFAYLLPSPDPTLLLLELFVILGLNWTPALALLLDFSSLWLNYFYLGLSIMPTKKHDYTSSHYVKPPSLLLKKLSKSST
uniref:DVL protein n=1 Tax=Solanum tuberosum TaxID=4113 RepID=M0ZL13_SOLTU